MNPRKSPPPWDANEEVSALIEVLHETEQRLEELTVGEVDTVADRDGRTLLLRRAQDQLRYREAAKQTAILNALPAHIALLDAQGLILSVNEAWRRFACADAIQGPGHRIGLNYLDICDGARGDGASEAHQVAEGIRSVLAGRVKRFSIEYPCHSPTEQRWFLVTATPLADNDYPNGAVVMHSAVTAQRKSEESLRASELRFRQMAENIGDVFFLQNLDSSEIFYVSPAYERIWGRTCESLYADPRSWTDSIHPDDLEYSFTKFQEGRNTGFDYEFRIVRPDGETRWIHARGFPILDDAGNPYRTAGVCSDITQRKQAVDELWRSESLKSAILKSSLDCLITIDHEGRIVEFNPAAEATFGLTREQALGKNMVELIVPPRLRDGHRRGFAHYLATGKGPILGRRLELQAIRADGTEFPIELAITAIGATSTPMFTGFIRDITARKEADEKIRRLNRVYAVLSGINTLIVRVRDRDELFREACRIAVEHGQFHLAWIGLIDRSAMKLVPMASAGAEQEFVTFITDRISLHEDAPLGNTMSARAVREKKATVSNEIRNDPRILFAKEDIARGIASMAILPLLVSGDAVGVLALYADEIGFFDEEEMTLLTELAGNIAFAIEHIEKEEKIDRLTRVHAVLTDINAAIVRIRDREELFRESCRIAVEAGQLRLAWIGVVDAQSEVIVPTAFSGPEEGLLKVIRLSTREDSDQFGMAGSAIRARAPVVSNDVLADERAHFRTQSVQRGFRSLAMIPLIADGVAIGVLGLHAAEPGFFNQDEMRLVMEVAGNIAFALEHIDKEEKVRRLTRVHAVLSGINALIVRAQDREELFREACRIAVENGQFQMAWIGLVDRSAMKIVPIASAGAEPEFLTFIKDRFSLREDAPLGNTMSARAVREKKGIVSNEMRNDPRVLFAKERVARGMSSMAVLPLLASDAAVGVLALYADVPGFFDEEEMKLLTQLAGNIAFAIDHIEKQERLDYLAYYDVLTGLANRRLFLERVAQYMRSAVSGGHKLAVYLIDLERFKNINDSLGQPAGDALLRQVAEWLTRSRGDVNLLARVEADHFAVVLPEVKDEADVARLLEKTMEAFLDHPFRLDDAVFRITAKVGVTLFPDDGADADTLFKNAEAALKKAKSSGDRYLFYTEKMTAAVAGKLTLENHLRQALDKEEFVLHYQPKVNFESGKITGAEALIRWNDPRTGLVPPGRFIPILEETGLIYEVGRWALRKAIDDYLRWRKAGLAAVRIAVNVSPLQLRNRGFIAEIEQAIGIDRHAAAGLELEITENMIMEDVKQSIASLQAIRAMGVSIAIDDFGTGFSSLSYLAKLPVDTLKIDRSFVIDMTGGPQGLALVSTIITLAHSLKLKVIAEGVETEEQSDLLRSLNCDEMQGFLFSKPVPREIFETRYLALSPAG